MERQRTGGVSKQGIARMPYYVQCLTLLRRDGAEQVSAPALAAMLGLNEVQVRKDLAAVSRRAGKPRSGFPIADLLDDLRTYLGYDKIDDAILVGVGSIGRALMGYKGFSAYGLRIVAAFDVSPALVGTAVAGKPVWSLDELPERTSALGVRIGIIAVPAPAAQSACDALVAAGVLAIWNFAPVWLHAPSDILIQNENMAASLAILSQHLRERTQGEAEEILAPSEYQ